MNRSDCELLHGTASGDQAAFAALYDRHAPRLLALLCKWLGDRDDAEDVLQETFWQVWSRAGRYDPARAAPGVWLLLLARSRALDHLRQRRREAPPACVEPATVSDPAGGLERGEASGQIRKALAQLPPEQRDAVVLAFYSGLTHDQVARRQAVPLGTAKTRIRLGMRRLRQLLDE